MLLPLKDTCRRLGPNSRFSIVQWDSLASTRIHLHKGATLRESSAVKRESQATTDGQMAGITYTNTSYTGSNTRDTGSCKYSLSALRLLYGLPHGALCTYRLRTKERARS